MMDYEKSRLMPVLADLLMGAAHADNHFDGREGEAVRAKLRAFMEVEELPSAIEDRLNAFDPAGFDLANTASDLILESADRRRKILDLVAAVHDADEELDLDEDAYLHDLAQAIGLHESDYADLKIEILSIEDARENFVEIAFPPPIPK